MNSRLLRVIQVLHHSLGHTYPKGEPESGLEGWHELVAREIAKRTPDVALECWRPEWSTEETHVWSDSFGVTHKVYPSRRFRYGLELSIPLVSALRRTIRDDKHCLLHLHGLFNLNTYLLASSLGGKVPIAGHSHDPVRSTRSNFRGMRNSLRKIALRKVDRFFLSSETETRELSEVCNFSKTRIAPMPVDLRVFHAMDRKTARAKLGWKADGLYVLYVGRLEERKGLRELMEASRMLAPRLPNLHFVAVGSGPLATESASNTTFLGQVRYEDLPTYYNAADTCVLPSHGESWGRVVLESLACQTPVIATWTGCIPALMSENIAGIFTVPIRNSAALAEKISQALSGTAAVRNRIERGKLVKYDSDNFVRQMLANYEELVDSYR